ncbi:MAG: beta-galactosidase [Armatimonadetes bacterium]|nr:beta-galactosidase [Armatimonadota bacterium]
MKWLFGLVLSLVVASSGFAERIRQPFNDGWEFAKAEAQTPVFQSMPDFTPVTLPHTWNSQDIQSGSKDFEAVGWYRKSLRVPPEWLRQRRIFLRFGAAGSVAQVFVNGARAGEHRGAYSAFCFEVTPFLKRGTNSVAVRVDNHARPDVIPINHGLFPMFGGLSRGSELIVTPKVNIVPDDYASSGVKLRQSNVSRSSAELAVTAKVQNLTPDYQAVLLRATIFERNGEVKARGEVSTTLASSPTTAVTIPIRIRKPHLWDGLRDPYLYQVKVELIDKFGESDVVIQPLGIRSYSIDAKRGFFLNGRSYRLYGVCRHEDWQGTGSAVSKAQHEQDIALIKEIGATSIRLAHYQQSDYFYQLCDEAGIVVWAEIPFVNAVSGQEEENAKQQITELVRQNFNHPSIVFWGLHNEVYGKNYVDQVPRVTRQLHEIAKLEDPDRFTVATNGDGGPLRSENGMADLQGINRYYGWYYGKFDDLETWASKTLATRPGMKVALAEYGAEGNVDQQSETLRFDFNAVNGQFFPENFETYFHELQWPVIEKHPELWASYVWNMFDFTVPGWKRGGVDARNMKGLVTYDRKTKKDAFYWYKAHWSRETVLHIVGRRVNPRRERRMDVEVFSNVGKPDLILNDIKLLPPIPGRTDRHWIFKGVMLKPGGNVVIASRGDKKDEVVWSYSP